MKTHTARQTVDRQTWNVILAVCDGDLQTILTDNLSEWKNGASSKFVSFLPDSRGGLDSMSAPAPA